MSVAISCGWRRDRDDGTDRQRQCHCPAVLLQGHAEASRSCRGARVGPRASAPARCSEPGRGRSAARLGDKHQARVALEPGLCHRPASLGGRIAQAHRYRSGPNGHPGRTRQEPAPAKAGGKKDRYVILSPILIEILREWWRVARKKGWMSPGQPWLFPGYRGQHTSARQLHRIVRLAAGRAGITKRVGVHTLRHCFATHLLEQKTDIRVIQVLLGHKKLDTTALYTRVAISTIGQVTSPLDFLRKMPG